MLLSILCLQSSGPFCLTGFLSTGDRYAPGNYALLDIVAALHWIADNIRAFGGDPDEVTLFGEDHGAALVNLLLLSPVTRGKLEAQTDACRELGTRLEFNCVVLIPQTAGRVTVAEVTTRTRFLLYAGQCLPRFEFFLPDYISALSTQL